MNTKKPDGAANFGAPCLLATVKVAIDHLSVCPADFQTCAETIIDVRKKFFTDEQTVEEVVSLLVEKSISNSNFCYSGARLCQVLHLYDVSEGSTQFKNLLIARCREELQNATSDLSVSSHGLLMFLGELYMNFQQEQGNERISLTMFGLSAIQIMLNLVKYCPTKENIKCIFQVLKLLGWEFENSKDTWLKSQMETLMKELSYVMMLGHIEPQAKFFLDMIFELKNQNWNRHESYDYQRSEEKNNVEPKYQPGPSGQSGSSTSQYYGLPETDLDDNMEVMMDDECEEVRLAFEEFLKLSEDKSSRNYNV